MSDQTVLMVPWEPRGEGWPTTQQAKVWVNEGRTWYFSWPRGQRIVVPFRYGQPVSWAEVDAAVEATMDLEKG